jgi:penicillin amidase
MKFLLRIVIGTLAALSGLAFCAVAGIYLLFWSSLPKYDGYLTTTHVKENVIIDRDDLGVPYIKARTRNSVTYGIGFVQGQDRFFQMDLQRRASSGELSALFGKGTLETDKELRIHGFRERAKLVWESLPEKEKQILDLFTLGVNEGLASLGTRPPEYWLLRTKPEWWKPEDSILVIYSFYLDLQNNPELDYARWVARKTLPAEVVQFLDQPSHSWEAPLDGTALLNSKIPGPEAFSYLKATRPDPNNAGIPDSVERMPGSNNWVVGPGASVSGFPILAGDPHLNLGVPNTWYKLSYSYIPVKTEAYIDVHGFTIPGMPGIIIGTNGSLAWSVKQLT